MTADDRLPLITCGRRSVVAKVMQCLWLVI
jgi:hypothetical protein